MEYPDRIYSINYNGHLQMLLRLNPCACNVKDVKEEGMPYTRVIMTAPYSDEPWSLIDYQPTVDKIKNGSRVCYSLLTKKYIAKELTGGNGETPIWTLDIEEAKRISFEIYTRKHPTGKSYDVVSYWDDCDRKVINHEPLLYSEARKLCEVKLRSRGHGSLYYFAVEVHKD